MRLRMIILAAITAFYMQYAILYHNCLSILEILSHIKHVIVTSSVTISAALL